MSGGAHLMMSAIFAGYVVVCIRLLRRRQLSSGLAMLWCGVAVVLGPLVAVPRWLDRVSSWVGINYPPALYLMLAVAFLSFTGIVLSRHVTRLTDQCRTLAERVAMLEASTRMREDSDY
jgi:hypothetical protein